MEVTVLSDKKKQALELNEQIIFKAQLAQKNLYDMCVMLKQMRDDKLYKELGYANFEDYCENEVGMKRANAYRYISVIENVKNVSSMRQIGMTKLSLLASLSEVQQEEIQQNVNLEDVSVKKLKAEIERLKEQSKKNERELSEENHELNCRCNSLVAEMNQLKDDNDKIRSAKKSMESDLLSVKSNNRSLRHQLDDAEKKIADLESRPVEVAVIEDKDAKAQINLLSRELAEVNQEYTNNVDKLKRKYQDHINELEEQLEKMSEQAEHKEVIETVDNTAVFDVYVKMIDKIIFSMGAHIAKDIDVGNQMIYNHQINELIRRLEKCLKK